MQDHDNHSDTSSNSGQSIHSDNDETMFPDPPINQSSNNPLLEEMQMLHTLQELSQRVHKDYQLIYIAAYTTVYRQQLEKIALGYNCDLSFVRNSYIVSCKDRSKSKEWTVCKDIINEEFAKIICIKAEEKDDKEKTARMYLSPEMNRFAKERGVYFCQFNSEMYFHSNSYSHKELLEKKKEIYKYCNIFTVCFCKKKTLQAMDIQIAKFYKTVLKEYYQERFQKNNLVVELDKLDSSFYILGKPGTGQKPMMEAKKTLKSLIEGLTIVAIKNNKLDAKQQAKLKKYLSQISKFPITYGKLSENSIVIISKDNVLNQLLKKTQKMKGKLGILEDTSMGVFMPYSYSLQQKKEVVNKVCKQMGYDYWGNWGIRYFRPMIASDYEVKDPMETMELIIRIIEGFMDVKDKHEVMKLNQKAVETKIDKLKKKQLEEQSEYAYVLKNASKDSKELMKLLRRDIMEDEVMMKKRYNVIYSILEGNQHGPYYIDKSQYDKGVDRGQIKLIEKENLQKGQFFETYLKLANNSIKHHDMEEIQPMLIDELRRLKQAAKEDKQEGKSFDNDRKIAHMIKKLIVVF